MRKLLPLFYLFGLCIIGGGIFFFLNDFKKGPVKINEIIISEEQLNMKYGTMKKLSVNLEPSSSLINDIIWKSSNPELVLVDDTGNVFAISNENGTAIITATVSNGVSDTVKIIVEKVEKTIDVKKIELDTEKMIINYGDTKKIGVNIDSDDVSENFIIWKSSNADLVKVLNDGTIVGIANENGKAIITATTVNGLYDSVEVIVNKINKVVETSRIEISEKKLLLKYGETYRLKTIIEPSDASIQHLQWHSSDASLVTVDEEGNIKAIDNREGKVIITVNTLDGKKDSVEVNVEKAGIDIGVDSVNILENSMSINYGETKKISVNVLPDNATNKSLEWVSSNPDLLIVDQFGSITVKNKQNGKVKIIAKSNNGKSDSIMVNVNESNSNVNLSLDVTSKTLTVGDRYKINAVFDSGNMENVSIKWTTSDNNVATVQDGLVTAKWGGSTTITAQASNGKIAKATITVKNYNLILDSQFLTTDGKKIVRNGNPIVLKGFNVGVWLSRSTAFLPIKPYASSMQELNNKGISCVNNNAILQLLSKNNNVIKEASRQGKSVEKVVQDLNNMLYNNFITEQDFDIIAQTGANVIRLPFEYSLFLYEENGNFYYSEIRAKEAFKRIDWAIEQCKKRGMYVIIDLHLAPGRQNNGGYCGKGLFFYGSNSVKYQNTVVKMWGKIAERYKNESAVAGYDILNEPDADLNKLVDFYNMVYNSIRNVDKKHIIFMEEDCFLCGYTGSGESSNSVGNLPNPSTKGWSNVVYSTHDYFYNQGSTKINENTKASVIKSRMFEKTDKIIKKRNAYNIPYYIGEFSHLGNNNDYNTVGDFIDVWKVAMDLYGSNGLSYTPWTYKGHWEKYYGLVFYGSKSNVSGDKKVDLLNDSYERIKEVFMYKSTEAMNFNNDFYKMFIEQYGGRLAKQIQLLKSEVSLNVNESTTVNYVVYPNNAINKQVTWSSSNSSIVGVDSSTGKIIAKNKGTAIITATLKPIVYNGETIKATYVVAVK